MNMLKKILPDPIFHFIIIGGLLFALDGFFLSTTNPKYLINIDQYRIDWIKNTSFKENGNIPNRQVLSGLIHNDIKQEVFFREALSLNLEKDDVIVRRRLIEKFKFMLEGMTNMSPPTEMQLSEFYRQNPDLFIQPERYSFTHYYFSTEEREHAKEDAEYSLKNYLSINSNLKPTDSINKKIGDPFIMRYHYNNLNKTQISTNFGDEFTKNLTSQTVGNWTGPIESIYGWHLIKISDRRESNLPNFGNIKEKIEIEFQKHQRIITNKRMYEALLAKYKISIASKGISE